MTGDRDEARGQVRWSQGTREMKPLIVGECNPYGSDPEYALYPEPEGCSGWRLCHTILRMHKEMYLSSFDRVNLCATEWDPAIAPFRAGYLLGEHRELYILLGRRVRWAFRRRHQKWFSVNQISYDPPMRTLILPHPSEPWNNPEKIKLARHLIQLCCPEIGVVS